MKIKSILLLTGLVSLSAIAQEVLPNNQGKFDEVAYRRGNVYRAASGVPGPQYFQNSANYAIEAELDDKTNMLKGKLP